MRAIKRLLFFVVRGVVGFLVVGAVLALTQDFQIFPEILTSLTSKKEYLEASVPSQVERFIVETSDKKLLEAWRLDVIDETRDIGTAIIFHGNAGTVREFFPYQLWLRDLGYRSYSFDYRGFGLSTGWPSESGIYKDTDAIVKFVTERERLAPSDLMYFGISVGTAPAAYAAATQGGKSLVMLSPYTSIPDVVRGNWFLALYLPVLRYGFPNIDFVRQLKETCVVIAHGKNDAVVPYAQSVALDKAVPNGVRHVLIADPLAGHNDLFLRTKAKLGPALLECSEGSEPESAPDEEESLT